MVNKHQFQLLAKAFRAGKISLSDFTEQAYNPPADKTATSDQVAKNPPVKDSVSYDPHA